jgi:hypothetical protein
MQYLSSSTFLDEIHSYLYTASRAVCYIFICGKARSCNCRQLLANTPNIIGYVTLALQIHLDLDKSNHTFQLVTEKRYSGQITKTLKDIKKSLTNAKIMCRCTRLSTRCAHVKKRCRMLPMDLLMMLIVIDMVQNSATPFLSGD